MSSVIKMEWFRFRRSKSAYIIIVVLAFMFLFGTILDGTKDTNFHSQKSEKGNNIELYTEGYDSDYSAEYSQKFEMLVSSFSGNIVPMAILIFAGLFAGAYQKNKFEKNIIGAVGKRYKLVWANLFICAVFCFFTIVLTLAISLLGYIIFYPGFVEMPLGNMNDFLKYLGTYYFLLVSIAATMSCFVQIIRNQILAIIIGLIYGSGIVYGIVDFISQTLGAATFSIYKYVPLGTLYKLTINSNNNVYLQAVLIAAVFAFVTLGINIAIRNRQDISV
ncbi:MAG: ABC transporter permease [Lachnospiraceae bacterium]